VLLLALGQYLYDVHSIQIYKKKEKSIGESFIQIYSKLVIGVIK